MTTWVIMRSSGLLAMLLLTFTVVLGLTASAQHRNSWWPRFLSQGLHRNVSLLAVALIAIHVTTAVLDEKAGTDVVDVVVPFGTEYRPVWMGLGTLAVDLMLAVLVTSGLRHRLGERTWRGVHYLAYAAWPLAVLHGLGAGTDARLPAVIGLTAGCTAAVVFALCWRAVEGRSPRRLVAALAAFAVVGAAGGWALTGPLAPQWSQRAQGWP